MPLRLNHKPWTVREQVIEDPVTELSIQFEVMPDETPRLRLFGKHLAFGNRELVFSKDGVFDGGGTYTSSCCPSWPDPLDGQMKTRCSCCGGMMYMDDATISDMAIYCHACGSRCGLCNKVHALCECDHVYRR